MRLALRGIDPFPDQDSPSAQRLLQLAQQVFSALPGVSGPATAEAADD